MKTTQDRTIAIGGYRFNEKEHLHELLKDGEYKPLTGVTTVLSVIAKPMLIQWAANMACDYISDNFPTFEELTARPTRITEIIKEARTAHRKKKEAAGDWGTDTHTDAERYIKFLLDNTKGEAFREPDVVTSRIEKFVDWAVENKVKFLASEKNLWSESMWVGGICDIICEIDGKRYVGDIKTSSGIYPEAFIQASAYAEMLKEMGVHEVIDGVIILNLKKDGTFDWQTNWDIEGNFNAFRSALTIYRHLNQLK